MASMATFRVPSKILKLLCTEILIRLLAYGYDAIMCAYNVWMGGDGLQWLAGLVSRVCL